jgi:hypothetical protein
MLSTRTQASSERCVNENLMAAYLEASLSPKETAEFESHVSDCAICRETLALAIGIGNQEGAGRPVIDAEPGRARSRFFRLVPVAGVLILAIALIPVISKLMHKQAEKPPKNQIAELHMAATPFQKTEITEQPAKSEPIKPRPAETIKIQSPPERKPLEQQVFKDKKEESSLTAAFLKEAETAPADLPAKSAREERTDESAQGYKPAATAPTSSIPLNQIDVGRFSALNSVPPMVTSNALPPTSMMLGSEKSATELKKIGDKEFYLNSGIWIDRQCAEHRDSLVIEVLPVVPEHEAILKQYPNLRNFLPAMVYWNGKIYLLR